MSMKKIFIVTALVFSTTAFAELYKWVDENGVIHYTDRPPSDSVEQQELKGPLARLGKKKETPLQVESIYSTCEITSPEGDSTVRSAESTIDIVVNIDPPLTENHHLQIYLDGLEVGEKTKSTELTLQKMKKGIHRLQGKILDENNQEVSKTSEVTFQFRKPADLSTIAPNLVSPEQ